MALSEDKRKQLDSIVSQMVSNKESDDTIQSVVNDFKLKYGSESKDIGLAPSHEKQVPSFIEAISQGAKNYPSGVFRYSKKLLSPETFEGAGNIASLATPGGWLNLYVQGKDPVEMIKGLGPGIAKDIESKYGSWDNFKLALANRPEEITADVSSILMGGAGLGPKAGMLGKITKGISTVGQSLDPLSAPLGILSGTSKIAKKVVEPALGVTTSRGEAVIQDAMKGGKSFSDAMRGKTPGEDIVKEAKFGVNVIKQQRENDYLTKLQTIENMPNPPIMDLAPVIRDFVSQLKGFKISPQYNAVNGKMIGLDFSRSPLKTNKLAQTDFNNLYETFKDAFNDPTFYQTPIGMDTLKQQLKNFYHEGGQARAAVSDLYNSVRKELVAKVPGYEDMVSSYEKTTRVIDDIERSLSLKRKDSADTALRKLNTAMREDEEFRRSLINEVERASGKDISAMVSGRLMRPFFSRGIGSTGIEVGAIFGTIFGNPGMAALAATASPRIVGETLNLLSKTKEPLTFMKSITPQKREALYQAGTLGNLQEQAEMP